MIMNKLNLLLALLLAAPLSAMAGGDLDSEETEKTPSGIYKTVGPDGRVTFSDAPPKGRAAERVDLKPTNVQPIALPRQLPVRKLSPKDRTRDQQDAGPASIEIVSPQNGTTITPGQRTILLEVAVSPVPRDGYEFFAVVDGQPWAGSSSGTSLDISSLERGSHSVQAVLLDAYGNQRAQSQTILIHVHRPGGQVPDNAAPQATQAPQAPVAPGVNPQPQPRRR
jgi:hypothetical protein